MPDRRLFEEASELCLRRTCEGLDGALAEPSVRDAVGRLLEGTARAHTDTTTPAATALDAWPGPGHT